MSASSSSNKILAICNPLLDISAHTDKEFLAKHHCENSLGTAILAEEKHLPIYTDILNLPGVEFIAGGSAQNTIRVCQWFLQQPDSSYFIGCIGKDENGKRLRESVSKDGVKAIYLEDPSTPTGTCAVCVVGKERALIANLAAANNYKHEHMLNSEEAQQAIKDTSIFYSSGFFLTVSPESVEYLGKHAAENNKIYATNISAPFIAKFFTQKLLTAIKYADYVFCNEEEARAFSEAMNWGTDDLKEIAKNVAALEKANSKRQRTVVFTHGKHPVVVCENGEIAEYPTPLLDPSKIIDTNGAGDSFVGGFLAQISRGKNVGEAVKAGNFCAQIIIQHSGCTFPKEVNYEN